MNHDLKIGHQEGCQICGAETELVLDLGEHSPCDSLLTEVQLNQDEPKYPLRFVRCLDCGLAQIDYVVDPKALFYPAYPYRSGITPTLAANLMGLADRLKDRPRGLVVDIGSNDGTVLQGFKAQGWEVLGVEPTEIADFANAAGIRTYSSFFSSDVARVIAHEYGKAQVVTAANVFAHVANLGDFLHGVERLLTDDGLFVTESHYLGDLLATVQYDAIYHEHLKYYSVKPLQRLIQDYDFTILSVERIPNYGGSIRVICQKGKGRKGEDLSGGLAYESVDSMSFRRWYLFQRKAWESRQTFKEFLRKHPSPGIGCPGRASTLLQYCGITSKEMPYIAEQSSSLKLGLYTPGSHIPVMDEAQLLTDQPDTAILLSWHYAGPIVKALRAKGLKSRIFTPLPELRELA